MLVSGKALIAYVVLRRSFFQQFVLIIKEYRCLLVQAGNVMQYIQPFGIVRCGDIDAQQTIFYSITPGTG